MKTNQKENRPNMLVVFLISHVAEDLQTYIQSSEVNIFTSIHCRKVRC